MALIPEGPGPYTTANAAVTAIEAYRERGMGTPITSDILARAGVPESIANRTFSSLKLLDLIDDSGEPTEWLIGLRQARGDEEYRSRLQEWLRAVYSDVLQYADPSTHSTDRIAEAFRGYTPIGQRQAMAALLVGLWKLAGLPVADASSTPSRSPRRPASPNREPSKRGRRPRAQHGATDGSALPAATLSIPSGLLGLLQQLPLDGESWTKIRRDEFVRAFEAVLDFTVMIREDNDSREPTPSEMEEEIST